MKANTYINILLSACQQGFKPKEKSILNVDYYVSGQFCAKLS